MMENIFHRPLENYPLMIMLVGLPGSGKSTFAANIRIKDVCDTTTFYPVIHSSDAIREELYGNPSVQDDPQKVFNVLHKRIKDDLTNGKDVVYDATNISKKRRIAFLDGLFPRIKCFPICVVMATLPEICIENNEKRERKVPPEVISRMLQSYNPPDLHEGFHTIEFNYSANPEVLLKSYSLSAFNMQAENFDQKNSHHSLTLGEHSRKAMLYVMEKRNDDALLITAAYLHDLGKLYTQTRLNHKGEFDGNYHYYNHHCVGAYYVMFILSDTGKNDPFRLCRIANYIYYHMHPFLQWKDSEKTMERDKCRIGKKQFSDIQLLHEADLYAH